MSEQLTINLGLMLLVASVVAIITRRLRQPYSVGLVAAGIVLALAPTNIGIPLSADTIYAILLPPLIFEGALQIQWPPFRRDLPVILLLAVVGVGLAAAVVAAGMHWFIGWTWLSAALFGVLIAATDPVSVINAFREMRVDPRLRLLVEAESLMNDGTAAVGVTVLLAIAAGAAISPLAIGGLLLWKVLGGVVAGVAVAGLMLLVAGHTDDHLVEITLTTIAAYGAFILAEHLNASGVLAAMAAGMVVGNIGLRSTISETGREHLVSFWEYAAFLANSLVFILIGLHEAHHVLGMLTWTSAAAVALAMIGRGAAVYGLCPMFARTRMSVSGAYQHVLVWGGLRGALALVLALTLPDAMPEKHMIILAAFSVVAFSIFVQGLTMPPLLTRLGLRGGG
jgi:monovalent cation:H+ antiporter, CPA1 family